MKTGDHIYVDGGASGHHGIYVHDQQVIHSDTTATIRCTTLRQFAEGARVQVQQHEADRRFVSHEVIERAKSQIGCRNTHRFEHFASWCITGDVGEQDLPIDIQRFDRRNSAGDHNDVPGGDSADEYLIHPQLRQTEDDVSVLPLMVLVTASEDLGGGSGPVRSQMESDVRQGPLSEGGRILDSLKANTPEWRTLLAGVLLKRDITPATLGFACAVLNPLLPGEDVGAPRINNRIDGVLDMLNCEFTAADAQGLFQEVLEDLTTASQSVALRRSVSSGEFLAGAAFGWFGMIGGPFAGGIGGAGDYVRRTFTPEHEYVSGTAVLTSVAFLLRAQGAEAEVTRIRHELGQQLSDAGRALGTPRATEAQDLKQRVARRALEMLVPEDEAEEPSEDGVPDVCGLILEDAIHVLAAHGLSAEALDVGGADGNKRSIWTNANWTVVTQRPTAGTPAQVGLVKLAVKKNFE